MDFGKLSSPEITVAPVVVRPDRDSNTASVIDKSSAEENTKGKQPAIPSTAQNKVTIKKPSLIPSSRLLFLVKRKKIQPILKIMRVELKKEVCIPSWYTIDTSNGRKFAKMLNSIKRVPRIFNMIDACIFFRRNLDQLEIIALHAESFFDPLKIKLHGRLVQLGFYREQLKRGYL